MVASHVTNRIIVWSYWTSWIFQRLHAAICFQTESTVWRPKEGRTEHPRNVQQWLHRGQWVWLQEASWARRQTHQQIWSERNDRGKRRWSSSTSASIGKPLRGEGASSAASSGKPLRGDSTQFQRSELEFHIMQISNQRYREKVLRNLRPEELLNEDIIGIEAKNTNFIDLGIFLWQRQWKPLSLWTESHWEHGSLQECKLRGNPEFVQCQSKVDDGPSCRDSECIISWLHISLMTEINNQAWSGNHVDKSQSACLRRFRLMFGKDLRTFGSELQQSNSYAELLGIDGGPIDWVWVDKFPRACSIGNAPGCPGRSAKSRFWTRRIPRSNRFCVFCSTTSIGPRKGIQRNEIRIPIKSRITRRDSRKATWHFLDQDTKRSGTELLVTNLMENGIPQLHRWCNDSQKLVTQCSKVSVLWVVVFWKGSKMETPLQYGLVDQRTLVSYHPLSNSAQYLRCSIKLVWRIRPKTERNRDFSKIREDRAIVEGSETRRSKPQGMTSRIRKTIARRSSRIWRFGYGNPVRKSLWCSSVLGISLCGYALQNYPWRWWSVWRSNTSMQRIHTSSWRNKFHNSSSNPGK